MPHADPARRRQAQREAQRRLRARRAAAVSVAPASAPGQPVNQNVNLDAADLAAVLWSEIQAIRAAMPAGDPERARVLCQLCSTALRCVETGDLARRLEALEQTMSGEAGTVLPWRTTP